MSQNPLADLKTQFESAHKEGMEALQKGEYDAFGEAVAREVDIIDKTAAKLHVEAERLSGQDEAK